MDKTNENRNKRCHNTEDNQSNNVEQLLKKAKLRMQSKDTELASREIVTYKQQQDAER
jgi:hypothetical protein